MFSLLRKASISMANFHSPSFQRSSSVCVGMSDKLSTFMQNLRHYRLPRSCLDDDAVENEERRMEESTGKVMSQLGFVESVTPAKSEPFRPKRAAVLVCLFEGIQGDLRVILTKRSSKLSTHSGEVSLPGGKTEEGDADDSMTATREAKEEIGLDPSLVNVITVLESFLSKHLLRVVPVVGFLSDPRSFRPIPNAAEVEAVFDVPLEMFLKDEKRRQEEREWLGQKYVIHFFEYDTGEDQKYMIWGLTAGILIKAATVVFKREPAFLQQMPRFRLPQFYNREMATL